MRASGADGFTLLEVLGALLIFFVVMTVLVGTSSEASIRIRDVVTRLEASELADRELAAIEAALANQQPPPEDREQEVDDFFVRVWSTPALDDLGGSAPPSNAGGTSDPLALLGSGGGGLGPMIAMQVPGIDVFLLRYDIRVEWGDELAPSSVGRTTYAFDWQGARAALPDLFPTGTDESSLLDEAADQLGPDAQELIESLQGGP